MAFTFIIFFVTVYNFSVTLLKPFHTTLVLVNTYGMKLLLYNSITYRTVTLDQATDNAKIIGKAMLNMFHTMKLNISDMRGVSV